MYAFGWQCGTTCTGNARMIPVDHDYGGINFSPLMSSLLLVLPLNKPPSHNNLPHMDTWQLPNTSSRHLPPITTYSSAPWKPFIHTHGCLPLCAIVQSGALPSFPSVNSIFEWLFSTRKLPKYLLFLISSYLKCLLKLYVFVFSTAPWGHGVPPPHTPENVIPTILVMSNEIVSDFLTSNLNVPLSVHPSFTMAGVYAS